MKTLKVYRKIVLFALILPNFIFSQLPTIPLNVDYTVFNMNDSLAYVEFYVSFYMNSLKYQNQNDTLKASFEIALEIAHDSKIVKSENHPFIHFKTDSPIVENYNNFSDVFGAALNFKKFTVTLSLKDNNTGVFGEYKLEIDNLPPPKEFFLSGIQLASKIEKASSNSKFVKNGLNIVPYAQKTFGVFQPMLYYYLELNKLSSNPDQSNTYDIHYFVTNELNDTLKSAPVKTKTIAASTMAEVGGFNIMTLPHGANYLTILVKDNSSMITAVAKKRFYVHKANTVAKKEDTDLSNSIDPVFQHMNLKDLNLEFQKASYIAAQVELDLFDKLDNEDGMRKFLTSFWKNRDIQGGIPFGESRRLYLTRCDEADEKFSTSFNKQGWKTEMGRIFVTYGKPDEIERSPSSVNSKPYIIWYFLQLQGGVEFIFLDRLGFGSYELIHSTYYKELQNPNWREEIQATGSREGQFGF